MIGKTLAIALTVGAGALVALQAPVNSRLGKTVGTFQAASVSFAVGLAVLVIIALVAGGGVGELGRLGQVPARYLTGGLLGAAYVACVLVTVRSLGAGGVTAVTITGQLTMAVVIDQLGLLGVAQRSITPARVAGLALLGAGVFLIVRR